MEEPVMSSLAASITLDTVETAILSKILRSRNTAGKEKDPEKFEHEVKKVCETYFHAANNEAS